ncbi:MAG: DUF5615 family PIN-like protein [Planctomycetes bacterium]|nr:DUF5615 family PIN-like protein [Planctomycetota bacterium]
MPRRVRFVPSLPLIHSTSLGSSLSDSFIWDYARSHHYVIITKDADFSGRIMLSAPPPWIVRFPPLPPCESIRFFAPLW